MRKECNRGFTLIELIISMAILTIVIFISYSMINNINPMFGTQLNTTNHQVSINNLNKFLSRDIQYSINVEGPIFSKTRLDGSEYTLNNIDKNDEVNYEYKITTTQNEEVTYLITIKNGKYSIYRNYNGTSLDFIDNDKLSEDGNNLKAPLVIEQSSDNELLYYVNLQSMDKKNNEYSFKVTSRHQSGSVNGDNDSGSISGDSDSGNMDGNEGSSGNINESGNISLDQGLVFEYKKLDKVSYSNNYNWEHKIKFKLDELNEVTAMKENTPLFSDAFAIVRYGEYLRSYTSSWHSPNIEITKSIVKEIKGFRLKFEDGIKIKNVNFMGQYYYGDLNESNKEYTFKLDNNMQNQEYGELLSGNVEIEENSKQGDIYTIEIEFIY